jgi:hypothetical protein
MLGRSCEEFEYPSYFARVHGARAKRVFGAARHSQPALQFSAVLSRPVGCRPSPEHLLGRIPVQRDGAELGRPLHGKKCLAGAHMVIADRQASCQTRSSPCPPLGPDACALILPVSARFLVPAFVTPDRCG